jgi:C1A family cysteine protease
MMAKYNLQRDVHDDRDLSFSESVVAKIIPHEVILEGLPVPVFAQGDVGSCTAQSTLAMLYAKTKYLGSRLFLYYNTRKAEGSENQDNGATLRNTIKVLNRQGVPLEIFWKYVEIFWNKKPLDIAYEEAEFIGCLEYKRLNNKNLNELKQCLADGNTFVFGFSVHENFDKHNFKLNPKMPTPKGANLGGHAVLCYGYDNYRKCFLIRNSWGSSWGHGGGFLMPYDIMTSPNCWDFWTITNILKNDESNTNNTERNTESDCFLANLYRGFKHRIATLFDY